MSASGQGLLELNDKSGSLPVGAEKFQTEFKNDPGSASNFDPLGVRAHGRSRRIGAGGEEETGPVAVDLVDQTRFLKRQLSLPVSTMSQ
jgi:hypothetical protein